jgi:hypothetical protein
MASLLIKEGRLDAREIADRMGHSVEMLERCYAHEIREYRGAADRRSRRGSCGSGRDERCRLWTAALIRDTQP